MLIAANEYVTINETSRQQLPVFPFRIQVDQEEWH